MELSSYRIFHVAATTRNMAKAAATLHLTPSAVSHAISKLEKEFGFPLFIREKNGITLTTYGAELLPQMRALLMMNNKLDEEIDLLRSVKYGTVHLGIFNSACCAWLPHILLSLHKKYPKIQIKVHETIYPECEAGLLKGILDIAIVRTPVADSLECREIYVDKLVCITPRDFHPHQEGLITIDEIQQQPLIFTSETFTFDVKPFFEEKHIPISSPHVINDDASILALVEGGLGVSILPRLFMDQMGSNVNILAIEHAPYRTIGLATQKQQFVTPATKIVQKEILDFLEKKYGSCPT